MSRFKQLPKIFIILSLVVIIFFITLNYRISSVLERGNLQITNQSGNLIMNLDGYYDQNRLANNRLFSSFLTSFANHNIQIKDAEYVFYRPLPNQITTENGIFYFNKDKDRIQIAENVEDFSYIDSVFIFEEKNNFNQSTSSLESLKANLFESKIVDKIECTEKKLNKCKNIISVLKLSTWLSSDNQIDLTLEATIDSKVDPKDIIMGLNINIPDGFKLCDVILKKCFSGDKILNPTRDQQDIPVEIYKNRLLSDRISLKDLKLDKFNFDKLELADLETEVNNKQEETLDPVARYALMAKINDKSIRLDILNGGFEVKSIKLNHKYQNFVIKRSGCEDRVCDMALGFKISLNSDTGIEDFEGI